MQRVAGAAGSGCRDVDLRLGLLPLQQLVLPLLLRFVVRKADTAPRWGVWPVACVKKQLAHVRSMPPVAVPSRLQYMNTQQDPLTGKVRDAAIIPVDGWHLSPFQFASCL